MTSFPIFTPVPHYVYSKHGSQSGPVKNRNQITFLCSNSPMTSHSKIKSLKWPITSCFPPHLMLWSPHCSLNTQVFFYLRTYAFIVPSVWNDYIQISSWLILQHSFDLYPITLSIKPPLNIASKTATHSSLILLKYQILLMWSQWKYQQVFVLFFFNQRS